MIQLSNHAYKYSEAYGMCTKLSNQAGYKYCGLNLLATTRVHRFDYRVIETATVLMQIWYFGL